MSEVISTQTGSPEEAPPAKLSVDAVFEELQQWRRTRTSHRQHSIPEALWQKILALAEVHGAAKVRQIFGVSAKQYNDKRAERPGSEIPSSPVTTPHATGAATSPPSMAWQEVKSPWESTDELEDVSVSTRTLVVEFCRADGKIMKIHTTTDRFSELMRSFFNGF